MPGTADAQQLGVRCGSPSASDLTAGHPSTMAEHRTGTLDGSGVRRTGRGCGERKTAEGTQGAEGQTEGPRETLKRCGGNNKILDQGSRAARWGCRDAGGAALRARRSRPTCGDGSPRRAGHSVLLVLLLLKLLGQFQSAQTRRALGRGLLLLQGQRRSGSPRERGKNKRAVREAGAGDWSGWARASQTSSAFPYPPNAPSPERNTQLRILSVMPENTHQAQRWFTETREGPGCHKLQSLDDKIQRRPLGTKLSEADMRSAPHPRPPRPHTPGPPAAAFPGEPLPPPGQVPCPGVTE